MRRGVNFVSSLEDPSAPISFQRPLGSMTKFEAKKTEALRLFPKQSSIDCQQAAPRSPLAFALERFPTPIKPKDADLSQFYNSLALYKAMITAVRSSSAWSASLKTTVKQLEGWDSNQITAFVYPIVIGCDTLLICLFDFSPEAFLVFQISRIEGRPVQRIERDLRQVSISCISTPVCETKSNV